MWNSVITKPESGRRIVALYADGSGSALFLVHDGGLLDAEEGEECDFDLSQYGYSQWAYLPDETRLWFEEK